MKTSILALTASTLLSSTTATSFSLLAARSASPIHFQPINANGRSFWIGKETASNCPLDPSSCPCGDTTLFTGGEDYLSMSTAVPGGQHVYIAPDGHLAFTQAHSGYMPAGSITTGFTRSEGENFGFLGWTNGLVACPTSETGWPYQIFARVDGFDASGCLGFGALTSNSSEVGAWQYA